MEHYIKSALRAANLQNIVSTLKGKRLSDVRDAFILTFPMGEHLYFKLTVSFSGNVAKWIASLDSENTKLFFESNNFEFLN